MIDGRNLLARAQTRNVRSTHSVVLISFLILLPLVLDDSDLHFD